jgi:hypothetical protein
MANLVEGRNPSPIAIDTRVQRIVYTAAAAVLRMQLKLALLPPSRKRVGPNRYHNIR